MRRRMLLAILSVDLVIFNSHAPKTEGELVVNHRRDLDGVETAILTGKTRGPVGTWMGWRSGSVPAVFAEGMIEPLWRELTAFCRTTIILGRMFSDQAIVHSET